jgi:hypothetical protein
MRVHSALPQRAAKVAAAVEVDLAVERVDGGRERIGVALPLRLLGVVDPLQVRLQCGAAAAGEVDRVPDDAVVAVEPPGVVALVGPENVPQKSPDPSSLACRQAGR